MIYYLSLLGLIISFVRGITVLNGLVLMYANKNREIRWCRSMKIAFPEPFLLVAMAIWYWVLGPIAAMSDPANPIIIVLGAIFSSFGILLFLWALLSNRGVGTGHYVEEEQNIVTSGPYALVRHPLYCSAIFVWLGLALTQQDWALLTLIFAYVIPAYFFYAQDEETMMKNEFGVSYSEYAHRVPMLFPKSLSIWE